MKLSELNSFLTTESAGIRWELDLCKRFEDPLFLEQYGYKTYSQNDEDGIIEEIFNRIGTTDKRFIEFGVQNGIESNGHLLLLKGWKGLWFECDNEAYKDINIRFYHSIQNNKLVVGNELISPNNVNELFEKYEFIGEIDLLSIDIDGNDYHVWKSINVVKPRVVVIEYNAKIPPSVDWIMPFCEYHRWEGNDKHGASLYSLQKLGEKKGYTLVGTNISGVNAFFVRNDCLKKQFVIASAELLYNPPRYNKKYYAGHPSSYCLADIPEGIKQVFLGTEKDYAFSNGFYGMENINNEMRWMSKTKSLLFLKNSFNKRFINIKYDNPCYSIGFSYAPSWIIIKIEDTYIEKKKLDLSGVITIELEAGLILREIISVEMEIDKMWKPSALDNNSSDIRELGIGIYSVYFS